MSQGRESQAWEVMIKLVPSAVHADTDNDNQDMVEIRKVCQLQFFINDQSH